MRLALISHGPPDDPRQFSGISWHVLQELRRQGHDVEPFYAEPAPWSLQLAQFKHRLSLKFSRQPHHVEADAAVLRSRSQKINQKISAFAPEAVLCVGFPEAAIELNTSLPLYIWMDALYPSVRRLYAYFRTYYSEKDAKTLWRLENQVLQRARLCWLSSEWAAKEAQADFPAAASKFAVQSFGANLENPPSTAEVEQAIMSRNLANPTLVFLANEWERKGGDTAVETVRQLRNQGCAAQLAIIGLKDKPASLPNEPWIKWVGRLDKGKAEEAKLLNHFLSSAAFLLLPSSADCTPIVCHEAAAFGLPVLATDVGGMTSTVTAGESGMLWPVAEFAQAAPSWINAILMESTRYQSMAHAARIRFEVKGNWKVNVQAVARAMADGKS